MLGIIIGLIVIVSGIWFANEFGDFNTDMREVTLVESTVLFWIVTIFAVIAASGTVAEEFSSGTIKLLLIRPWSRSKILLSKYVASLVFAFFMTVVFIATVMLVNWILFDLIANAKSDGGAIVSPIMVDETDSLPVLMTRYYLLTFVNTVMTVTISFMLSTIFRSNVLAIAMALFIEIVLNNLLQLLQLLDKKWIDFLIFVHLDLTKYAGGNVSDMDGMTLGFSLSVLAVYYVLFIALTWFIFNKRDVAS